MAAQCLRLCGLEAGQDLNHQKLTSGLWNAFFTGSLDEATNYASHGPILQSLTFIKHLLKPSEERKHRSVHRSVHRSMHKSVHRGQAEKTASRKNSAPENGDSKQLTFYYSC